MAKREEVVTVRLSKVEKAAMSKVAHKQGMQDGAWARAVIVAAVDVAGFQLRAQERGPMAIIGASAAGSVARQRPAKKRARARKK